MRPGCRSRREGRGANGEGDTDDQQQELLILVAARLAADEVFGLDFEEIVTAPDDASARAEILLLSSSILVPCLRHDGATVWDTLAIGEYLNEAMPMPACCPQTASSAPIAARSAAKSIPASRRVRASLPVNLKAHFPGFKIWSRAQADIDRVSGDLARLPGKNPAARSCSASGAPWRTPMYAPVVTRFVTHDVKLEPQLKAYAATIMAMPK